VTTSSATLALPGVARLDLIVAVGDFPNHSARSRRHHHGCDINVTAPFKVFAEDIVEELKGKFGVQLNGGWVILIIGAKDEGFFTGTRSRTDPMSSLQTPPLNTLNTLIFNIESQKNHRRRENLMENTVFCSRVAYRENTIKKFAAIPLITYSP